MYCTDMNSWLLCTVLYIVSAWEEKKKGLVTVHIRCDDLTSVIIHMYLSLSTEYDICKDLQWRPPYALNPGRSWRKTKLSPSLCLFLNCLYVHIYVLEVAGMYVCSSCITNVMYCTYVCMFIYAQQTPAIRPRYDRMNACQSQEPSADWCN